MRSRIARWFLAPLVVLVAVAGMTQPAWAGEDKGMCNADDSRVHIPRDLPIDACFDGHSLYLLNGTQFPLVLTFTGNDVGNVQRYTEGAVSGASTLLATIHPADFSRTPVINAPDSRSGLVPPRFHLKASIGNGEAKVHLAAADAGVQKAYFIAETVWRYVPLNPAAGAVKAVAEMLIELSQVGDEYVRCRTRNKNAWGDVGCSLLMGRNVAFAVGRAIVNGLGGEMIRAVIDLFETDKWAQESVGDLTSLKSGARDFDIAAYIPPPPPKTQAPPPLPPQQVPPPVDNGGGNNGGEGTNNPPPPATHNPPPPPSPQPLVGTVQNKHLAGASGLEEDSTPSYLSTVMQPRCAANGCKIDGTEMWSGATFEPVCWDDGAFMTNQNTNIPGDDNNPNRIDTTRWMRARVNGQVGYISFIYITPESRNLGVSHC